MPKLDIFDQQLTDESLRRGFSYTLFRTEINDASKSRLYNSKENFATANLFPTEVITTHLFRNFFL